MIPVSIQLKNFFSHKDSFLDFTEFNSALIVGCIEGNYDVSNGAGKSSLLSSILWCLFNKARTASIDDIITWGEKYCIVEFVFKHKGELYKVVRQRSRTSSTSTVSLSMLNYNSEWIDLSKATASLTNQAIIDLIKIDYNTFINSAYFRQNDISEFAESDASTRKHILKSIIDISRWDGYEIEAKEKLKACKAKLNFILSDIEELDNVEFSLESNKEHLDILEKRNKEYLSRKAVLVAKRDELNRQYQDLRSKIDTNSWDRVVSELSRAKKELLDSNKVLKSEDETIKKYQKDLQRKEASIRESQEKAESISIDEEIDLKIEKNNKDVIDIKSRASIANSTLKTLSSRTITHGECYVCRQGVDDDLYEHLIKEHNESVEENKRLKVYCKNKLIELEGQRAILVKKKRGFVLKQNLLSQVKTMETEATLLSERLGEVVERKSGAEKRVSILEDKIAIGTKTLESLKNETFKDIQKELSECREQVADIDRKVEESNRNIGKYTERVSVFKEKVQQLFKLKKKYNHLQNKIVVLDKFKKICGKNGIQTILLNAVIEDLEKTANQILTSICNEEQPFMLYLDTQRVGADGVSVVETLDLRVKKDGVAQNFKSLSGGEKFRIALALRIALSEISSRHGGSSLEFLLLDEINSPLDRHGTEALFANVIKRLEERYKILVITHNEFLKEKFEDVITISKIDGESSISYSSY